MRLAPWFLILADSPLCSSNRFSVRHLSPTSSQSTLGFASAAVNPGTPVNASSAGASYAGMTPSVVKSASDQSATRAPTTVVINEGVTHGALGKHNDAMSRTRGSLRRSVLTLIQGEFIPP